MKKTLCILIALVLVSPQYAYADSPAAVIAEKAKRDVKDEAAAREAEKAAKLEERINRAVERVKERAEIIETAEMDRKAHKAAQEPVLDKQNAEAIMFWKNNNHVGEMVMVTTATVAGAILILSHSSANVMRSLIGFTGIGLFFSGLYYGGILVLKYSQAKASEYPPRASTYTDGPSKEVLSKLDTLKELKHQIEACKIVSEECHEIQETCRAGNLREAVFRVRDYKRNGCLSYFYVLTKPYQVDYIIDNDLVHKDFISKVVDFKNQHIDEVGKNISTVYVPEKGTYTPH